MPSKDFPPLLRVSRTKAPLWRRILLIGGAMALFVVGIFGWLIPVVTGIPFYIAGLILLGMASPAVLKWINKAEARLSPKWRRRLRDGLEKVPIKKVRESVRRER